MKFRVKEKQVYDQAFQIRLLQKNGIKREESRKKEDSDEGEN